ncbi:hypothetical protein PR202_gb00783 [Eleusine coracana subsp. coracana]|uniref:Kinesin-like protein n=1 Tax=Eleusine coracana subsp. coracana TaxID=191504 RepID=A0AAV5DU83_ELECO|nr:hypothetical protein PR202_gb00783 [Eleusine coracana subsp. coracana]
MEASTPRRGGDPAAFMSPSPSPTPRATSSSATPRKQDATTTTRGSSFTRDPEQGAPSTSRSSSDAGEPPSDEERRLNAPVVITCNEQKREVSVAQSIANKQIDRTFLFDKQDVFNHAVVPLVNEVLDGYNCTIFAYGQTGTGKTYTMEGGGGKAQNGELPSDAGVIPRAVKQIFDILDAQSAEYSMKVSFLELYNEELTDLLAPEEPKLSDDKSKKPMALMEDGKGGVFVRGLEEEVVSSAAEIYKILEKGSAKRKTAETLLNKQSSRSHSIFSITIHIKECTPEGEEMIKSGKLNLVDLAGSENVSRSGARDVNQKMMKSALIKDLFIEMDRLKQELYAAREKNGVYIPREQFLADEAEKKVNTLIVLHLHTFYLCLYFQFSLENVLVDEAQKLQSELENTAGDLSGLFSKLERKGKIEDANKTVVQHFRSQLTEDMGLLHRTVSTSVSQQESQLKSLEERMQSFVSSKGKVAGGLQEHVRKLKESFNSSISELHGVAEQLKLKSHLSFEKINSHVTTHMSGLEDFSLVLMQCLKGLLVDADQLLVELQNGLSQQELNFAKFFKQQHEELSRNLERSKSVSTTTVNFFRTIDAHTLVLIKILEESQSVHKKQLLQLQKKFEVIFAEVAYFVNSALVWENEFTKFMLTDYIKQIQVVAADEEKYLMEKIAGLLTESNARKKNMVHNCCTFLHDTNSFSNCIHVQDDICSLDKTVCEHSNNMQTQTTKLHDFTSCMREQWEAYMERAEEAFHQNVSSIEQKRCFFMENLQQCKTRAESCSEQWSTAQNSVLALGRSNAEAIRSAISYLKCTLNLLLVSDSLKLDLGICDNVKSIITASKAELHELLSGHQEKTKGISGNADRSLGYDYKVDEPTCSTPRRREINIPSRQSIGHLATPALEDLVKSFWDSRTPTKLAKGNGKSILETQRAPLATVN